MWTKSIVTDRTKRNTLEENDTRGQMAMEQDTPDTRMEHTQDMRKTMVEIAEATVTTRRVSSTALPKHTGMNYYSKTPPVKSN